MRRRLTIIVAVGALGSALAGTWLLFAALRGLEAPLGAVADGYVLDVAEGRTWGDVTRQLGRDGVLARPQVLRWYGRWQGLDQRIQAGEYLLDADLSARGLLDKLVAGEVRLHGLTVVEGWTVRDLLAAIRAHPAIRQTLDTRDPGALPARLGLDLGHAEGWFFPDTYYFARGTTDVELLRQAHALMAERLAAAWDGRATDLPLAGPYEALVLASVIERETALDAERSQIAGVFVRRLRRGMRLQTDPTVIYGLGVAFDGNLTRRDLRRDTPYNTYTRAGLPPTPIALPGEASLRAAVAPADGEALFFVATGLPDGSHTFSATLEEHNAAVAVYLARLRRSREGS